jgi:hypothetical protein
MVLRTVLQVAGQQKVNLNGERLLRSTDNVASAGGFVEIPSLDPKEETAIHSIVFSPAFDQNKSVFVAGHNIGLALSKDGGASFDLLWDPRDAEKNGTVTTVSLSLHFETDGTIALLVDNCAKWGHTYHPSYDANVYLSEDRGSSWRKLTSKPQQWIYLVVLGWTSEKAPVLEVQVGGS